MSITYDRWSKKVIRCPHCSALGSREIYCECGRFEGSMLVSVIFERGSQCREHINNYCQTDNYAQCPMMAMVGDEKGPPEGDQDP